jgi:hypothetical protein
MKTHSLIQTHYCNTSWKKDDLKIKTVVNEFRIGSTDEQICEGRKFLVECCKLFEVVFVLYTYLPFYVRCESSSETEPWNGNH